MRSSRPIFARRHRRRWPSFVLLLGVLVVGAAVVGVVSDGNDGAPESIIADELDRDPDIPILVPEELPAGYRLLGVGRKEQDAGGRTALATWLYGPADAASEQPLVEVCVSRRGRALGEPCTDGRTNVLAAAEDGRLDGVAISLGGGGDAGGRPPAWLGVELTPHWGRLAWVADPQRSL